MASDSWELGDIGDFRATDDLWPIGSAAVVGVNFAVALAKLGGVGGLTLSTYFDTFGLEGILANASWVVILMQAARWIYTTFYAEAGSKAWSPFVFVCILILVQLIHDLLFYYGLVRSLPSGRNEMVDALKRYANAYGPRALFGHSAFLLFTAIVAMFLKETTFVTSFLILNLALYMLPLVITVISAPPPKPVAPPAEKKEAFGGMGIGGGLGGGNGSMMPRW